MAATQDQTTADPLVIAGRTFGSRLLLGTGGFRSLDAIAEMRYTTARRYGTA